MKSIRAMLAVLSLSAVAMASPITCHGTGVYCDAFQPELEGRLLINSSGAMGLITWLSQDALTDYTIYAGPVQQVSSGFYVQGIPGTFYLWQDAGTPSGTVAVSSTPEPATAVLIGLGFIALAMIGRRRKA